jgi:transcriptional regulator with XRE-family HTH domain
VADPLSEPTVNRRLHAAYLAKGWTRADFARRMGVKYQTVDRWDTGEFNPGLDTLFRAAELVGYTPAQLLHGRDGAGHAREPVVDIADDSMTAEEREALDLVIREIADAITPAFVASYRAEIAGGATRVAAAAKARDLALEARAFAMRRRAVSDAVLLGAKPATDFATPRRTRKR